jgi:hypothetical protein
VGKFEDLSGQRFGKLTVIRRAERSEIENPVKGCSVYWLCKCDCGGTKYVATSALKGNHTKSCGCLPRGTKWMRGEVAGENVISDVEKVRAYLCEKHGRKCFTSPAGKCPLANYGCYDCRSVRDLFKVHRGATRAEIKKKLSQVIKADELKEKGVL